MRGQFVHESANFVAGLHWICNGRTLLFIFLRQSKRALQIMPVLPQLILVLTATYMPKTLLFLSLAFQLGVLWESTEFIFPARSGSCGSIFTFAHLFFAKPHPNILLSSADSDGVGLFPLCTGKLAKKRKQSTSFCSLPDGVLCKDGLGEILLAKSVGDLSVMYGMLRQAFPARSSLGSYCRKHTFTLTTTTTKIWFQRSLKCTVQTGRRGAMD